MANKKMFNGLWRYITGDGAPTTLSRGYDTARNKVRKGYVMGKRQVRKPVRNIKKAGVSAHYAAERVAEPIDKVARTAAGGVVGGLKGAYSAGKSLFKDPKGTYRSARRNIRDAGKKIYNKAVEITDFGEKAARRKERLIAKDEYIRRRDDVLGRRKARKKEREKARKKEREQQQLYDREFEKRRSRIDSRRQERRKESEGASKVTEAGEGASKGAGKEAGEKVGKKSDFDRIWDEAHEMHETFKKDKEIAKKYMDSLDSEGPDGTMERLHEMKELGKAGFKNHFFGKNGEENRSNAIRGILQTAGMSAIGNAGLAALQGDDMWDAAKSGAFWGAIGGTGYQGMKGITGAATGTVRGNMKHIARTTKDMYNSTSVAGREALRKDGMSGALATLMRARREALVSAPQNHTL